MSREFVAAAMMINSLIHPGSHISSVEAQNNPPKTEIVHNQEVQAEPLTTQEGWEFIKKVHELANSEINLRDRVVESVIYVQDDNVTTTYLERPDNLGYALSYFETEKNYVSRPERTNHTILVRYDASTVGSVDPTPFRVTYIRKVETDNGGMVTDISDFIYNGQIPIRLVQGQDDADLKFEINKMIDRLDKSHVVTGPLG
jgi:hypothetical protein